jgi:hypothetical protein
MWRDVLKDIFIILERIRRSAAVRLDFRRWISAAGFPVDFFAFPGSGDNLLEVPLWSDQKLPLMKLSALLNPNFLIWPLDHGEKQP